MKLGMVIPFSKEINTFDELVGNVHNVSLGINEKESMISGVGFYNGTRKAIACLYSRRSTSLSDAANLITSYRIRNWVNNVTHRSR